MDDNIIVDDVIIEAIPVKKKKSRPKRRKCTVCNKYIDLDKFDTEEHKCSTIIKETKQKLGLAEPKEEPEKQEVKEKTTMPKELAAQNLFNLQFTAYCMIEQALKVNEITYMDGLHERLKEQKEQYLILFEQIYEEHGAENIEKYLSPTILWAGLSASNVIQTFAINKKKESEK